MYIVAYTKRVTCVLYVLTFNVHATVVFGYNVQTFKPIIECLPMVIKTSMPAVIAFEN